MAWTLKQVGAKFPGNCIVCRQSTNKIPLDATPLYVREGFAVSDGEVMRGKDNHGVAHPACVGASWKQGVGRARIIGTPAACIDTDAPKAAAYVVPAEQMAELERLAGELRETAAQRPATEPKPWKAPATADEALAMYGLGRGDQEEVDWALKALPEKVAARKTKILAATPGRKIEMD